MGRLSPQEIREREFKQSALGYSREQVQGFLAEIADELGTLTREYNEIHQKYKEALLALQTYSNVEESLRTTLVQAQENARKSLNNAQDEADNILRKAQTEKDALLFSAKEDLAAIQSDIRHLKAQREAMLTKLKSILRANLDVLNESYLETETIAGPLNNTDGQNEETIVDFSKSDLIIEDLPEDNEASDTISNITGDNLNE